MRALINRLNGGTDTLSTTAPSSQRRSSKLVYQKYPTLPMLVLRLLLPQSEPVQTEPLYSNIELQTIFPALEIVERFGLPNELRQDIEQAARYHMEGPSWALRMKAAKALSVSVDVSEVVTKTRDILEAEYPDHNALHGRLLFLKFIISHKKTEIFANVSNKSVQASKFDEDTGQFMDDARVVESLLLDCFQSMVADNMCPFTVGAFLDLVITFIDGEYRDEARQVGVKKEVYQTRVRFAQKHGESLAQRLDSLDQTPSTALLRVSLQRCKKLFFQSMPESTSVTLPNERLPPLPNNPDHHEEILRFSGLQSATSCGLVLGSIPNVLPLHSEWSRSLVWWTRYSILASIEIAVPLSTAHNKHQIKVSHAHDLPVRIAAIRGISSVLGILMIYMRLPPADHRLLPIYFGLYDAMNDDDDEVREIAATATSAIFSNRSCGEKAKESLDLSPPAARTRLMIFLADRYKNFSVFWDQALARATGDALGSRVLKVINPSCDLTWSHMLQYHRQLSYELRVDPVNAPRSSRSILFQEEKQNLYLDPVREANIWTQMFMQTDMINKAWASQIANHSCIMADSLLLKLRMSMESRGEDGSLGPFTDQDLFAYAYCVIRGTCECM